MIKFLQKACPDNAALVVECGFVPDKIVLTNQTTLITLEWNTNLESGDYYKIIADGTRTLETSGGPTLIDGSDKTNYVTSSFGFVLPAIADINDTLNELLDIEVYREDQV
jgi:hypothetical protein